MLSNLEEKTLWRYGSTLFALRGGGWVSNFHEKSVTKVRFNIISVTMGWVGVKFPGKKHYEGTVQRYLRYKGMVGHQISRKTLECPRT